MLLVLVVTVVSFVGHAHARGAGRAFPLLAENYAIDTFQNINPTIQWDPTNFLVDKSGEYANCNEIGRGSEEITEMTPEGETIRLVYDYVEGTGVDAESVNGYIRTAIDRWMRSREHHNTIQDADRFGCSVRPGCRQRFTQVMTVACLFSPGRDQNNPPDGEQKGLAFTAQQYDVAELITGNTWDRSHFLENLSGYEITCAMLNDLDWTFKDAKEIAAEYGHSIMGLDGKARNYGSTQVAMEHILKGFKVIRQASKVGCSVIPDCTDDRGDVGGEMWVVVACIYEEPGK